MQPVLLWCFGRPCEMWGNTSEVTTFFLPIPPSTFDPKCLVFLAVEPEDKFDQYPSCFETKSILGLKGVHTATAQSQIRVTIDSVLLDMRLLLYWTSVKCRRLRAQHCQLSTPSPSHCSKQQSAEHSSLIPVMIFDTRLGNDSFSPKAQRPGMTVFPALS